MPITVSSNYTDKNSEQSKRLLLVVKIAGVPSVFTQTNPSVTATYGDGSVYGQDGLVYGGTDSEPTLDGDEVRQLISFQGSSMTVSQKLEPEQGRASVTNMTLSFIDKDSYMTQVCTPGLIIPDILGAAVDVYLGYQDLSYPEDFLKIFRGYVSSVSSQCGLYSLQMSDPNVKRRQQLFVSATTTLSADIDNAVTTVPLVSVADFYQSITGPDATVDTATTFYVKIGDEFISYTGISTLSLTGCVRGARGTVAVAHTLGDDVALYAQIQDHAITMALKLMLSGWNGPFETDVTVGQIGSISGVGTSLSAIEFPVGTNLKNDYGLVEGDWITLSGATNAGNNGPWQIQYFSDSEGYSNRVAHILGTLTLETTTSAVAAFRSQYDTYPVGMGLKLSPKDVDVDSHTFIKHTWIPGTEYSYQFLISGAEQSGKTFMESQIYLPFGLYSLTKRGQLSVGITKPPIGDQTLYILNQDNILDGNHIRVQRATNMRKFFNQISYEFDLNDAGEFLTVLTSLDTDSLNQIGLLSVLPIQSNGAKTVLGSSAVLARQADFLLSRYKSAAFQITLSVNWGTGNMIEAGDVVGIQDNGTLQIANWVTGTRDLGFQLFEVEDRRLDITTGRIMLTLISSLGAQATDRFGFISPSSLIASASGGSSITIIDSFGALYPGNESRKWRDYVGQTVYVHDAAYSVTGTTTLQSIDQTNSYLLNLSPPLGFTPASGYILDIPNYSTSIDPTVDAPYKAAYVHFDPQVAVVSGTSDTQLSVSASDALKFFVGSIILVHNASYSQSSSDVTVSAISGTLITTGSTIGFTPSSSHVVELIGFADQTQGYRIAP